MFTALAENFGDVQNKINLFVALAPITHLFGSHNEFFNALSKSIPLARQVLHFLGIYEFFGDDWHKISGPFCTLFEELCDSHSLGNVPYNDYNDIFSARVVNKRQ